nr:pectinesterase family protein [Natranaerovirga hydrolytica]
MIVAKDGSGDYTKIQEAIDSTRDYKGKVEIHLKQGIYKEKLFIEQSNVEIIGENKTNTIITNDDYGKKEWSNNEKMGTFRSYTVFIGGDDFKAKNITFENSSGCGRIVGQAVAVYANGDRCVFEGCYFLGSQDTLFTGPLPLKEKIQGGFKGPGEHLERKPTRQLYKDCYIKGDIDFIFGSAQAVFYNCEIESVDRQMKENGYITAPSTPEGQEYGYVFIECKLTSTAQAETVYLGRPWRNHAKAAFINCWLGAHIHRLGWHDWDKEDARKTVAFVEYNNKGPGANDNARATWSKILTEDEANEYQIEKTLPVEMLR